MKVNIYAIERNENDEYNKICQHFIKLFKQFGNMEIKSIFNKDIAKAHKNNIAKSAYTKIYEKYLDGYNIALDPNGKKLNSFAFSKICENKQKINFFIGGAYGFEENFLKKCDIVISLSDLTFSHKITKIILSEQIFRAFSIINNHPYHKI